MITSNERLVAAERVVKGIQDYSVELPDISEGKEHFLYVAGYRDGLKDATKAVNETATADAKTVVRGKWITWEEAGNFVPSPNRHERSVCHDAAQVLCNGFELLSPHCPSCGAYMEEMADA